jgi:hypothetical protein
MALKSLIPGSCRIKNPENLLPIKNLVVLLPRFSTLSEASNPIITLIKLKKT